MRVWMSEQVFDRTQVYRLSRSEMGEVGICGSEICKELLYRISLSNFYSEELKSELLVTNHDRFSTSLSLLTTS